MTAPLAALRDRLARRAILTALGRLRAGTLDLTLPDGTMRTFRAPDGAATVAPHGVLHVHDDAFFSRVAFGGEVGFGEAYVDRLCSSPDIVDLIRLAIQNRRGVNLNASALTWLARLRNRRLHIGRRNTPAQAKHNIHAHYDMDNAFFSLFLDDTLTYSSAYFQSPGEPLAEAQRNKYRMVCLKAGITRGDHVLEIGSGWGGFAIFAAGTYGCRVTTITISREQLELATRRIAEAGLDGLVDVRFCDYRDVAGAYDKIISIEMFEAVGAEYFGTFFQKCDAVLKPTGRMVMQVITVPERGFAGQLRGVNWIQKYIFPGGILPSLAAIDRSLAGTSLLITGTEDIGLHYAPTLRQWRERFWEREADVRAQGFDDRFMRTWDYYLASCEAGFLTRNTCDHQIVFEKVA